MPRLRAPCECRRSALRSPDHEGAAALSAAPERRKIVVAEGGIGTLKDQIPAAEGALPPTCIVLPLPPSPSLSLSVQP